MRDDGQWHTIGYSTTAEGAQAMCDAIAKAPSCVETRVIDREAPLHAPDA